VKREEVGVDPIEDVRVGEFEDDVHDGRVVRDVARRCVVPFAIYARSALAGRVKVRFAVALVRVSWDVRGRTLEGQCPVEDNGGDGR
jgi:hypothetical protein